MLAKKLELKEISECKIKRPEIPTKIKVECEKYISTWNEKTFEEIVTMKSPPRRDEDSITLSTVNNKKTLLMKKKNNYMKISICHH